MRLTFLSCRFRYHGPIRWEGTFRQLGSAEYFLSGGLCYIACSQAPAPHLLGLLPALAAQRRLHEPPKPWPGFPDRRGWINMSTA